MIKAPSIIRNAILSLSTQLSSLTVEKLFRFLFVN
jgi:hypothetical protein